MHRKCFITTHSGAVFDLLSITPDNIDMMDVAHSLSNMCRFNGHCRRFYPVAEHLVRLTDIAIGLKTLTREDHKWVLLHDVAEVYIGDIITPVKVWLGEKTQDAVKNLEEKILIALAEKLSLTWPIPDIVWELDRRMLVTEFKQLMIGKLDDSWKDVRPFKTVDFMKLKPIIKNDFLSAYSLLFGD